MVQRCGFFVAPIREHLQEMGLIIPTLVDSLDLGQAAKDVYAVWTPVPEPTTALMLTLGLAVLGMRRRVR
jgi:hypothetical protein